MSDCSTHAFDVPTCERGILHEPERPTLKRLAKVHGEPPWQLSLPYPDMLPREALDFIGTVNLGGVAFERFEVLHCAPMETVRHPDMLESYYCGHCGHLLGVEVFPGKFCPECGWRVIRNGGSS